MKHCDAEVPEHFLRDLQHWEQAPVPICFNGDYRALTFCCKPGCGLTYAAKCQRDVTLRDIGLSAEEFIAVKEEFSLEHSWDAPETCFGSLSYCCMRSGGCSRRDLALSRMYPDLSYQEALGEYFRVKRLLAQRILHRAPNQEKIGPYIEKTPKI